MTRDCIIVSPHFPPSMLAGVHRARHLAKHLPAHGWRPIVVRVAEAHYTERTDPALAALVPASVEQVSTSAIPAGLARLIGVGDIGLRAYSAIKSTLARIATERAPKVVLITGSPYYPMMLAGWIRRRLQLPVVLDFQDPWVSSEGASQPILSKAGISHLLAGLLEPSTIRNAAFVTSVSEIQNREMTSRYRWLNPNRMAAIPIGGDPEDFPSAHIRNHLDTTGQGRVELAFVGSVWPRLSGTLEVFLDGVSLAVRTNPAAAQRLVIRFYGTDARLTEPPLYQVAPYIEGRGLSAIVEEYPQRLPFVAALTTMANASGLILLGSDEPHYTASKIYPALMSGRPFLSVFHAASSAHEILRRSGGGIALGFDGTESLRSLVEPIADSLVRLTLDPQTLGAPDPAAYETYSAHAVAGRFAQIFNQVSNERARHECALRY